jgi:predicted CXXCH cytochrome family protein
MRLLKVVLLGAVLTAGCTTEKLVYRNRPPFNPPPDSVAGFLGYYDAPSKTTTCGNCHVEHQADWKQTKHASAWADLIASGHSNASCYGCHTVNGNGNQANNPSGYLKTADTAYHDVQCESCHGPGLAHVTTPDASTHPLARLAADTTKFGCGGCHTGTHEPFVEEWRGSLHSQVVAATVGRPECGSCHDGKTTLVAWGVNTHYIERDSTGSLPTTCAVCHDPHGSPNSAQLRFAINTPDPEQNLCMKCHARRSEPAGGSYGQSPHAPQGPMLLGTAGYRPSGFAYDTTLLVSSHGSQANPELCAGCHVQRLTVTDKVTNAFVFQSTGHLFLPVPCLDSLGIPSSNNGCPFPGDPGFTSTTRNFGACANSGCHASTAAAQSAFQVERGRIAQLADEIWIDVNGNGKVDAFPTDSGYLAKVKQNAPTEFNSDSVISPAEGALFNVRMVGEGRDGNADKSFGVHNPFLAEALLRSNVTELENTYSAFLPAPSAAVQAILASPLAGIRPVPPRVISAVSTPRAAR